ncbi:MAG: GIY-YIG nuclease family protein [Terriglobia bacterium]
MPYFVYILCSVKDGKRYIGSTRNLGERLRRHSRGEVKATKHRRPLKLIYLEEHASLGQALAREKLLKSWAGRIELGRILTARGHGSAPNAGKLV